MPKWGLNVLKERKNNKDSKDTRTRRKKNSNFLKFYKTTKNLKLKNTQFKILKPHYKPHLKALKHLKKRFQHISA